MNNNNRRRTLEIDSVALEDILTGTNHNPNVNGNDADTGKWQKNERKSTNVPNALGMASQDILHTIPDILLKLENWWTILLFKIFFCQYSSFEGCLCFKLWKKSSSIISHLIQPYSVEPILTQWFCVNMKKSVNFFSRVE